ncbi:hypothetical protein J3A83DRAFT_4095262 [Scleroderma citrinum]
MEIGLDNIDRALGVRSQEKLAQNLARVFSKLLDPAKDVVFVLKYTDAIKARLKTKLTGPIGLDVFGKTCLSAGIVKTLSELIKLHRPSISCPKEISMAQYNAIVSLHHLFVTSCPDERATIVNQFLSHDVVGVLMKTLHHYVYTLRYIAAQIIVAFAFSGVIQGRVSMAMTAEIIVGMCQLALEGSEKMSEQLNSPALHWLWELSWRLYRPILRDPADVACDFAQLQEFIIFGVCWLIRTNPPLTCKRRLELLKEKPEMLDLLFDCVIIPRSRFFPTSLACSMAWETIILLFRWPSHTVPGFYYQRLANSNTLSQCLAILTSRKDWAEKIIDAWMKVEEEDYYHDIRTRNGDLQRRQKKTPLLMSPRLEVCLDVSRYRGAPLPFLGLKRIGILRLISTLTHTADSCGVTNAAIESLLCIAYKASHRIPRKEECQTGIEYLCHVERNVGKDPPLTVKNPEGPEVLFKIGNKSVLGPTALARLLVVLAQRKALDTIQGLKKPRNGLSSCTSLHQIQQITHPAIIRRFLTIALERVITHTQEGHNNYAKGQYGFAQIFFVGSAELAAALVAFDSHTEGQYSDHIRGARRELVIALGNASEAALKQKGYLEAENFGLGAISAAKNIPVSEGLDPALLDKIQCCVRKAQALSMSS